MATPHANATDYAAISQRTTFHAIAKMLETADPIIILSKLGDVKPLPRNKANQVKFRRPVLFAPATTPLTEGTTPAPQQFSYEDVSAVLAQYGAVVEVTDVVEDTAEDPVLMSASEACGQQAAETKEAVTWGVLRAGTSVFYTNGSARNTLNTTIDIGTNRQVVRYLKGNRARPITRMLAPSVDYETRAVEAAFVAVTHTNMDGDVRNLPNFTVTARYGSRQPICPEELGTVEDTRFITSPMLSEFADAGAAVSTDGMISTTGTVNDVFPIIYMGMHAFGTVALRGRDSLEPSIIPVGRKEKVDVLGQLGYVGWKTWHVAVILNDEWLSRVECTAQIDTTPA